MKAGKVLKTEPVDSQLNGIKQSIDHNMREIERENQRKNMKLQTRVKLELIQRSGSKNVTEEQIAQRVNEIK